MEEIDVEKEETPEEPSSSRISSLLSFAVVLLTLVLAAAVYGSGWHSGITSAAGAAVAGLVALATGLALLFEFRRRVVYLLRRGLRQQVLGHLGATYSFLSEGLAHAKNVDRTGLVDAAIFINDAWPSPSGIGWSHISESDPTIEEGLRSGHDQTVDLIATLPASTQIYWRHLYSTWEILSFEISREALGKGYVTDQWVDAADDWCICLIALHENLRQNPLGRGPSDAPVVALLERLRMLSAADGLFKQAGPDDLVHIHVQDALDGPYLLVSDLIPVDELPTNKTYHSPAMERVVPVFIVELEDVDGQRRVVGVKGWKWSVSPDRSSRGPVLAKFDFRRWESHDALHALDLGEPSADEPPESTLHPD